jgi:hypothetical protein
MIKSMIVEGVDINVADVSLASILKDMVEASQKAYGSHIRIAAKFNDMLPFAWYDMAATEKSENATAFKVVKTDLYTALKAAGHTNPSVPFKRICDYGRNMTNGLSPSGKFTAEGDPVEADSDGAGPAPRSAMLRNVEERIALWKFNDKQGDALPAKIKAILDLDAQILALLGVDVATIAK